MAFGETSGEFLVVWEDGRDAVSGGYSDIYGRRVGAGGAPNGGDFRISGPSATAEDGAPAVAWNSAGDEFLVVWRDGRSLGMARGTDIYGRRVDADGVPIGGDFRISGNGAVANDEAPAVVWNETAGEFLVVWQDDRKPSDRSWDIYGRRVGGNGVPIGSDFRISGNKATSAEFDPAVAWNETGNEYLVAWNDYRNTGLGRGSDIYARRVGAAGVTIGGDFRVCGGNAIAWEYEAAVDWNNAAQEYLVVWNDYRNNNSGRGSDIYGKRVGADGSRVGSDLRISGLQAKTNDDDPTVVWNEAGNHYLVAWADRRNVAADPTRGSDIYGRLLEADLTPVGSDFRISGPDALNYELDPAAAWNPAGQQYLVVWSDLRSPDTERDADIYGRRVNG